MTLRHRTRRDGCLGPAAATRDVDDQVVGQAVEPHTSSRSVPAESVTCTASAGRARQLDADEVVAAERRRGYAVPVHGLAVRALPPTVTVPSASPTRIVVAPAPGEVGRTRRCPRGPRDDRADAEVGADARCRRRRGCRRGRSRRANDSTRVSTPPASAKVSWPSPPVTVSSPSAGVEDVVERRADQRVVATSPRSTRATRSTRPSEREALRVSAPPRRRRSSASPWARTVSAIQTA